MYAFANLLNTIISLYIWCLFIFVILATGFVAAIGRYVTVMVDYVALLPALSNPF